MQLTLRVTYENLMHIMAAQFHQTEHQPNINTWRVCFQGFKIK